MSDCNREVEFAERLTKTELAKNAEVNAVFERYGVTIEEES